MSKQETKGNENKTANVYLTYDFAANLYSNKDSIIFYLFFHERKVDFDPLEISTELTHQLRTFSR